MDVGEFLRELGLGQYETAFRDNAVDRAVLPTLTSDDLKELGVSLIGHRRRLLSAIAALREPISPSPHVPARTPEAERRQITVLFCDLVGSTALSARLDPEDLRALLGRYHACVAETARRFDGFVAKYMGVQARAGAGCRLLDLAERNTARAAPQHCRNLGVRISRNSGCSSRAGCASSNRSRPAGSCGSLLASSWKAGARTISHAGG